MSRTASESIPPAERLLSPADVGERLRLNAADVRQLIRDGRLAGVRREVRGGQPRKDGKPVTRRPRVFVLESELRRFMAALPPASDAPKRRERSERQRMNAELRAELDAAVQYV